MYPLLKINKKKILENTETVVSHASEFGIDITAITKGTCGNIDVAQAFIAGGAKALGDSRLKNLKKYHELDIEKWLIRIPMISEAEEAVQYATISLNSELKVVEALNEMAQKHNKIHKILLMIDLGDLREGYFYEDNFFSDVEKILRLKNIEIAGIGTNLTCLGTIIPKPETYDKFGKIKNTLQVKYGIDCKIASGGNSSSYYMVDDKTIPNCVNNLRIGELLLIGNETAYFNKYDYMHSDAITIEAEVVEAKEKPSMPIGEKGRDSFGKEKTFVDMGIRKKIICALGRQDTSIEDITPIDDKINIIGASSDHLVLDVTECKHNYCVGDIISFKCNYVSTLFSSTSEYVEVLVD